MTKYRRKPIKVDVWQYDGSDTKHQETWPDWLKQESENNLVGCWDNGSSISLVVGNYDDPT
jgi:hypothetical protein